MSRLPLCVETVRGGRFEANFIGTLYVHHRGTRRCAPHFIVYAMCLPQLCTCVDTVRHGSSEGGEPQWYTYGGCASGQSPRRLSNSGYPPGSTSFRLRGSASDLYYSAPGPILLRLVWYIGSNSGLWRTDKSTAHYYTVSTCCC